MKLFKKLAILTMALTLCVGVSSTAIACGGEEKPAVVNPVNGTTYNFKVVHDDGTAATGYSVQLCTIDNTRCLEPVAVGTDGKVAYNVPDTTIDFVLHINDKNNTPLTALQVQAPALPSASTYDGSVITITLLNVEK